MAAHEQNEGQVDKSETKVGFSEMIAAVLAGGTSGVLASQSKREEIIYELELRAAEVVRDAGLAYAQKNPLPTAEEFMRLAKGNGDLAKQLIREYGEVWEKGLLEAANVADPLFKERDGFKNPIIGAARAFGRMSAGAKVGVGAVIAGAAILAGWAVHKLKDNKAHTTDDKSLSFAETEEKKRTELSANLRKA